MSRLGPDASPVEAESDGPLVVDASFNLVPLRRILADLRQADRQRAPERTAMAAGPSAPTSVHWEITNRCNLACLYCYNNSSVPPGMSLPRERLHSVADQLVELGILELTFSGGEVFTEHSLFWGLAEQLHRARIALRLITNGWFLSEQVAARLKNTGFEHVLVSLDSPRAEVHDGVRGRTGSWRRAVLGIGALVLAGLKTTVICVLTKRNADSIDQIIDLCQLLGVRRLIVEDLREAGRAVDNASELRLSDEEYERVYLELRDRMRRSPAGPGIAFGSDPRLALEILCSRPPFTCCVRADGSVVPIEALPVSYGNVATEPFENIWNRLKTAYATGGILEQAHTWSTAETGQLRIVRSRRLRQSAFVRSGGSPNAGQERS